MMAKATPAKAENTKISTPSEDTAFAQNATSDFWMSPRKGICKRRLM